MNKPILITLTAVAIALPTAHAQLVVEDVASIAQDAVNQVVDLGKYIEMVNNQVRQITTMTQELQQVTAYVKAFGDPSQLLNITGANELVSSLQQSGVGRTIGELQTASGIESLKNTGSGLYQSIASITVDGRDIPRNADLYKKFGALENTTSNYSQTYSDVGQRTQVLKGQLADTTNALQASSTDAETQKLQGVVTGQAAQLNALHGEVASAASTVLVQDVQNRNDAEKQEQAQIEADSAQWGQATAGFDAVLTLPAKMRR